MAIERVVFPMKYGDFPVRYVNVYQRVECLKDDQMTFPDVMIFRIVSLRHGNAKCLNMFGHHWHAGMDPSVFSR